MKKTLGELLKELREAKGYSMNQLAIKAGIDVSHVSRIEKGERTPKLETIKKIIQVLGHHEDFMSAAGYLSDKTLNSEPDLDAPLREKNRADALLKISELDSEFDIPDEVILTLIKKVREKYGPLPREGGVAAHGPNKPGTNALRKEDFD